MSQLQNTDELGPYNVFEIKIIQWSEYEHRTPILLQDLNGPCPLIALVNTLLLQNDIDSRENTLNPIEDNNQDKRKRKIEGVDALKSLLLSYHSETGLIGLDKLLSQLGSLLLIFLDLGYSNDRINDLDKLLESLPLLHTGLSVNPNLTNGNFPQDDLSTTLFGLFGLNFKHGWCVADGKDEIHYGESTMNSEPIAEIFQEFQTFDKIQDFLLYDPQQAADENSKLEIEQKQGLVKKWLECHQTQLTDDGMKNLSLSLNPDEFTIFFRNNHFGTLYKKNDGDFYLLITDASFNKTKKSFEKIVWQSLISASGKDDLFFTGDFLPVLGDDEPEMDQDYLLIKQLQEEDDEKMAREMQERYSKPDNKNQNLASTKDISNDKRSKKQKTKVLPPVDDTPTNKKDKSKRKRDCVIV